MDYIKKDSGATSRTEPPPAVAPPKRQHIGHGLLSGVFASMGLIIGIFLLFVVVIVYTTDIKLSSSETWTELGLTFFVWLFCSYSMYVSLSDTGTKRGKKSALYIDAMEAYNELKDRIVADGSNNRMLEFCRWYIDRELEHTRRSILLETGITYEKYMSDYIGKDAATLKADTALSKVQVKAILCANNTKPIELTPEMITRQGRGKRGRAPLGVTPKARKIFWFIFKAITTSITSIITAIMVLQALVEPTWITFVTIILKIAPVILNGFLGFKLGYENITVDTVNYMDDQSDLMKQVIQYVKEHPTPIQYDEPAAATEQAAENAVEIVENA